MVAPLGTALTPDQAALLKRFAPAATILYDSDLPGLRATFRAGDELLRHGIRVRVATLPPGEDPDTLVRREGWTRWRPCCVMRSTCSSARFSCWSGRGFSRAWNIAGTRWIGYCRRSGPQRIRSPVNCIFRSHPSGRGQQGRAGAGAEGKRESGTAGQRADAATESTAATLRPVPGDGAIPKRSYWRQCSPPRSSSREPEKTLRRAAGEAAASGDIRSAAPKRRRHGPAAGDAVGGCGGRLVVSERSSRGLEESGSGHTIRSRRADPEARSQYREMDALTDPGEKQRMRADLRARFPRRMSGTSTRRRRQEEPAPPKVPEEHECTLI